MTVQEFLKGCEHDGSYIPVNEVIRLMKEYAEYKCKEAIRNTRHKAVDILMEEYQQASVGYIANQIQNIRNQDVMPKFE